MKLISIERPSFSFRGWTEEDTLKLKEFRVKQFSEIKSFAKEAFDYEVVLTDIDREHDDYKFLYKDIEFYFNVQRRRGSTSKYKYCLVRYQYREEVKIPMDVELDEKEIKSLKKKFFKLLDSKVKSNTISELEDQITKLKYSLVDGIVPKDFNGKFEEEWNYKLVRNFGRKLEITYNFKDKSFNYYAEVEHSFTGWANHSECKNTFDKLDKIKAAILEDIEIERYRLQEVDALCESIKKSFDTIPEEKVKEVFDKVSELQNKINDLK